MKKAEEFHSSDPHWAFKASTYFTKDDGVWIIAVEQRPSTEKELAKIPKETFPDDERGNVQMPEYLAIVSDALNADQLATEVVTNLFDELEEEDRGNATGDENAIASETTWTGRRRRAAALLDETGQPRKPLYTFVDGNIVGTGRGV